tara:strand:+ start:20513 stop:20743 length:231 start_codon:yes stop_codon:yes gene_type:complete
MKTCDKDYNPNKFIDYLIEAMCLKNDAALSRELGVMPPVISKIRNGKLTIGASILIKAHEKLNVPTLKLRKMMVGE